MSPTVFEIRALWRTGHYALRFLACAAAAYTYANMNVRAHVPAAATPYSGYPAGSELLFDVSKVYKAAMGNVFEEEEWGPLEWTVMAKHYERQGQAPYAYHAQYMAYLASGGRANLNGPGKMLPLSSPE